MADQLASTLAALDLNDQSLTGPAFDAQLAEEDSGTHRNCGPRQRSVQSATDLKAELEEEFLTPSPRFSSEWLNRLQRYVGSSFPSISMHRNSTTVDNDLLWSLV